MVTRSISVFSERGSEEWEGGPAGWYRNCEEHSEAAGNPKPGAATAVRQSGERPGGWESYERAEDQGKNKERWILSITVVYLLEVVLLHSVLYFRADLVVEPHTAGETGSFRNALGILTSDLTTLKTKTAVRF